MALREAGVTRHASARGAVQASRHAQREAVKACRLLSEAERAKRCTQASEASLGNSRRFAKQNEQPVGVPLWASVDAAERDTSMDAESTLPILAADVDISDNAMLQLLKRATEQNGEY